MRRLWLAGLAAAALVAVAVLLLRDTPPTLDEAASDLVASGVPGVIVRVRDGEEVRELAKGEASVDDRFRIASVTKTFVAALTLDLARLGIVSLDETVADFEPHLVSDAAEITIRELLSHRAGLFDYTSDRRSCAASSILALWSGSPTGSRAPPATRTRARTTSSSAWSCSVRASPASIRCWSGRS